MVKVDQRLIQHFVDLGNEYDLVIVALDKNKFSAEKIEKLRQYAIELAAEDKPLVH